MARHSLICVNNSNLIGSFAVFQQPRRITMPGQLFPLAWLARAAHPGTIVAFEWSSDYCFAWSATGELKPGVNFVGTEVIPADFDRLNSVRLGTDNFGASLFSPPDGNGTPGYLTIRQLASINPNEISIGVGMSGSATCAIQAGPNLTGSFRPEPNYWVMFGNYQAGDVLDPRTLTGAQEVTYGGSLTERTATLGLDNLITIS